MTLSLRARFGAALTSTAVAAALLAAPAAPVAAAPDPCPEIMSVRQLGRQLRAADAGGPAVVGTGLTVTRGTEPVTFTAENFSVLVNGLGPDRDLILADLSGAGIDTGAGVWAGMSGSPVYVDDKLVGAVAYSLSFGPTPLAGITPAEDMVDLLDGSSTSTAAAARELPSRVRLTASQRRQVAARGAADVGFELRALPVPLSFSSVGPERMGWLRDGARGSTMLPVAGGGVAANTAPGDPADIKAGGNFAAALSYGDITAAGVGTTTMVCGDQALAFGHPFSWSGRTRLSTHGAVADRIVRDPIFGGFKLARPTAPVGRVTSDRKAGLRATLGAAQVPSTTPVTSRVVAARPDDTVSNIDRGRTEVVRGRDLPFLSLLHMLVNIDHATDRIGPGSSRLTWTVDGRYQGEPFTFQRTNRYTSRWDVAEASIFELYGTISRIRRFPGAPQVSAVAVDARVTEQHRFRRITGMKVRVGNRYRSTEDLRRYVHTPGEPLHVRVELLDHTGEAIVRDFTYPIGRRVAGRARIAVHGGGSSGGGEEEEMFMCFLFGECGGNGGAPATLPELLDQLGKAPRNDDLLGDATWQRIGERRPVERSKRIRVDQVVLGRKVFRFQVGAGPVERAPDEPGRSD